MGGLFVDFGAVRTATVLSTHRYLVRNAFLNWDKDASGSLSYDEFRA